jgi:hypothetical protein
MPTPHVGWRAGCPVTELRPNSRVCHSLQMRNFADRGPAFRAMQRDPWPLPLVLHRRTAGQQNRLWVSGGGGLWRTVADRAASSWRAVPQRWRTGWDATG